MLRCTFLLLSAWMPIASLVQAHMAMWHPSGYGFASTDYDIVTPMAKLPFEKWVMAPFLPA